MDEIIRTIKQKIKLCADSISTLSTNEMDRNEAEAIEHLSKSLNYLYQIKEKEGN